jgi:2-polyprenyl-3-methyl-5-hydroxy-6-metoxy-1,4-benzoquinol methylase
MFIKKHQHHYDRLRPYCLDKSMLMLGNQYSKMGTAQEIFGVNEYKTIDPDGGDYTTDIQGDLSHFDESWDVVFNLGTIEHVWDVHQAYSNTARLVKVGGYYIGHAPVENYNNHGIHVTNSNAILKFFELNGFELVEHWTSDSLILWHVAKKISHQTEFVRPQQVWIDGNADHFE